MRGRDTELPISTHGARRFRKRVQLPARAAIRAIKKALAEGLRPDELTGPLREKVRLKRIEHHAEENNHEYRVYRGFLYIFDGETFALITVIPIPDNLVE